MITTVTLNPSIDATWFIDTFQEDAINRVTEKKDNAGGKGINISRFLTKFQVETLATGLVGGNSGKHLKDLLEDENVHHVFVNLAEGETRTNVTLFVRDGGRTIKINHPGPTVNEDDMSAFKQLLLTSVKRSKYVAFSGKNPPGVDMDTVIDMLAACKRAGAGIAVDSESFSKENLAELKPQLYKPNATEFKAIMGGREMTVPEMAEAAQELCKQGVGYTVVSLGDSGLLGVNRSSAYMVKPPRVNVASTVGAGDAVVAGFLMASMENADFQTALVKGAACGTAMCTTEGTEIPDTETVIELEKQIVIEQI